MKPKRRHLLLDKRGSVLVEATIVLPAVMSVVLALIATSNIFSSRRAIESGLETALRYAVVRSATATSALIANEFTTEATRHSSDVGLHGAVTVTPASGYALGGTVTVAIAYSWTWPFGLSIISPINMNRTASATIVN